MDARILGLAGSLGAVGMGGGAYWAFKDSTKPISSLLSTEKGLLLITQTSDEKWRDAWKNYKGSQNKWGIKDWSTKQNQDDAPEEFKEACQQKSKLKVSGKDSQEYKDIKAWCTRPKKVSELLSSEGQRVLLSQSGDEKEWGEFWKQYRERHKKQTTGSSVTYETEDELKVSNWSTSNKNDSVPNEYKTACQTQSNTYINVEQVTNDSTFKKVEKWCTKPKNESSR
ncbi:hypothetical protein HF1_08300 [Mycoplasma haemofelis str. Langford 1]|uniref:Uncharacterized protein n=2 Tax=Mycoplasma haemofelis TaxID=29501 RepID=F6FIX0_MYCHI|nr:hypothetical protein [Mycoplasma haemofelis]AEG73168.1 hypothetical protein MHF_0910 [Mycoplasma haemofelis Ohio2]CBY92838.1 hypothetical protein HF1_08300 [Mycoplasma haemofelis str. Langford 1]